MREAFAGACLRNTLLTEQPVEKQPMQGHTSSLQRDLLVRCFFTCKTFFLKKVSMLLGCIKMGQELKTNWSPKISNKHIPSTNIFLVAEGSVQVMPSSSRVTFTWHPNRLVSVSPNAMSSMSFSSSSGSGKRL